MQIIINRHSTTGNVYPNGVNMQESIDSPPSYSTYSGGDSLACTACITIIILYCPPILICTIVWSLLLCPDK